MLLLLVSPGVPCHPFPLHLLGLPGLLVPALASPRATFPYASLLLYPWPASLLAQWGSFSRNVHFCMKYRLQGGKKWDIDFVPYVETLEQSPHPPPSTLVRSLSPPCHRAQNHLPNKCFRRVSTAQRAGPLRPSLPTAQASLPCVWPPTYVVLWG